MPDNGDGDKSSYLESEWVFKTINWCFYSLPLHLNVQISQRTWMHSKLHRGGRAPLLSTVWVSQRFAGWKWGLQKCPNCTEISEVLRRAYYNAGSNQKLWSLWIERRCFWSVASVDNELVLLWSLCVCVCVSLSLWWSVFLHLILTSFNFPSYFLSAVANKCNADFIEVNGLDRVSF